MVRFNQPHLRAASQTSSIHQLIKAALTSQAADLRELQLDVEVNVESSIASMSCDAQLELVVGELLRDAIARSPSQCELSVSAFRTQRGIEIEIADSTPVDEKMAYNAFSRCAPQTLNGLPARLRSGGKRDGWELYRTRCPQGGQAWTLVLTSRLKLARAA